ncbi:MAG: hypothetical protein HY717_23495 [Planctomycetes bacterium]|nr:hypothetical protein [Planctomycetota bacterium]
MTESPPAPPFVCARCGCLCDDLELRHEGGRIDPAANACDRGADWLNIQPLPASADFQKGGR